MNQNDLMLITIKQYMLKKTENVFNNVLTMFSNVAAMIF